LSNIFGSFRSVDVRLVSAVDDADTEMSQKGAPATAPFSVRPVSIPDGKRRALRDVGVE
jgi:hypothetical protein